MGKEGQEFCLDGVVGEFYTREGKREALFALDAVITRLVNTSTVLKYSSRNT